jgi:hypothetical protein
MRADGAACIYADHSSNSLIIERLVTSGKLIFIRRRVLWGTGITFLPNMGEFS